MNAATIISIIAALGLGTPITVILTRILNRKKDRTDAAEVVQGMAIGVAQEIREQLADVRTELEKAQQKIHELTVALDKALARAQRAEDEVVGLRGAPPQGDPLPGLCSTPVV